MTTILATSTTLQTQKGERHKKQKGDIGLFSIFMAKDNTSRMDVPPQEQPPSRRSSATNASNNNQKSTTTSSSSSSSSTPWSNASTQKWKAARKQHYNFETKQNHFGTIYATATKSGTMSEVTMPHLLDQGTNSGHLKISTSDVFRKKAVERLQQTKDNDEKQQQDQQQQQQSSLSFSLEETGLIGRQDALEQLREIYAHLLETGSKHHVAIDGLSGSGKSTLVSVFCQEIVQSTTVVCRGKFDLPPQASSAAAPRPYTAISQALDHWVEQQQQQNDATTTSHNNIVELQKVVGQEWSILVDLVPSLGRAVLLQEQSEPKNNEGSNNTPTPTTKQVHLNATTKVVTSASTSSSSQQRMDQFQFLLRRVVRHICTAEHPLVLFLDDVQWADSASMQLVQHLWQDDALKYFLLVTAHRSGELTPEQDLLLSSSPADADDSRCTLLLSLSLWTVDQVQEWLTAVLLPSTQPGLDDLARMIHAKTQGNPYFVQTFCQRLVQQGLIVFCKDEWTWNKMEIQTLPVADNLAQFVHQHMAQLPSDIASVAVIAACLGHAFDLDTLEYVVAGLAQEDLGWTTTIGPSVEQPLQFLCQVGVLNTYWTRNSFAFCHDQIQTAALGLVDAGKRQQLQLTIGARLIDGMIDGLIDYDTHLFLAVDLCNVGKQQQQEEQKDDNAMVHVDPSSQQAMAFWEYLAGTTALKRAAFASALVYLEQGLDCLGRNDLFASDPELALALLTEAVEAAFCAGKLERMEEYAQMVLSRKELSIEQKVPVSMVKINMLGAQERFVEAFEEGRTLIQDLGVARIAAVPSQPTVIWELIKTKRATKGWTQAQLLALPESKDTKRNLAMGVMARLASMGYNTNPTFFMVITLKSIRWTLKYGTNRFSPVAMSTYAMIASGAMGNLTQAMAFGEAALAIAEERGLKGPCSTAIAAHYGFVYQWSKPFRQTIAPHEYGYQIGMQAGEVEHALCSQLNCDMIALLIGAWPLDQFVQQATEHTRWMRYHNHESLASYLAPHLQFALNLTQVRDDDDPTNMNGSAMQEDALRTESVEKKNVLLAVLMDFHRFQLAYMFGEYATAARIAESTMDLGIKYFHGGMHLPRHAFMVGMVSAALLLEEDGLLSKSDRSKHLKLAKSMVSRLDKWCKAGNPNCSHLADLLHAELEPDNEERYKQGIVKATRGGFVHDTALGHERAALFYARRQKDAYWYEHHFEKAIEAYREWGATVKIAHMQAHKQSL